MHTQTHRGQGVPSPAPHVDIWSQLAQLVYLAFPPLVVVVHRDGV